MREVSASMQHEYLKQRAICAAVKIIGHQYTHTRAMAMGCQFIFHMRMNNNKIA
jgi:hypothetical protein